MISTDFRSLWLVYPQDNHAPPLLNRLLQVNRRKMGQNPLTLRILSPPFHLHEEEITVMLDVK